jgi:thiosulfate dehydrogenase
MFKRILFSLVTYALVLFIGASIVFSDNSPNTRSQEMLERTLKQYDNVQVVKACDGRKRVIVEGFKEGEILPEDKARQVAYLLTRLMKYCNMEFIAIIPENRIEILLSIEGKPFITVDNTDLKLPLTLVHGGQSHTSREMKIWNMEEERVIAEGYKLFHSQLTGTNGVSCDMCHPDASNTHPETYPKFQTQLKKVALLRDMINWCLINPLEGKPLTDEDERLKAIEAYILSTRKGVPLNHGKH